MAPSPKINLIAVFSMVAACSFFATPAMAAAASEESSVADAPSASESSTKAIGLYTEMLPDGSIMGCPLPWLATAYGPVGRCTAIYVGERNTVGRVGFFSPFTRKFSPTSGWLPASSLQHHDLFEGGSRIIGFGTLETPYGPATFATQYRYFANERVSKGNWGSYNFLVRRYFADNNWWPLAQ
jgi:hypothetical protein